MKVTAIISAYYAQEYLHGRLRNLLEQDVPGGLQIVAVCQYGSWEFECLSGFMRQDGTNMQGMVMRETPGIPTVYDAWNMALRQAQGEYVTNANSDDRLCPGALAELAQALDENPQYAVVYANVYRVAQIGGEPTGQYDWLEGGLTELLSGCFLGPMPMWRRALHDKYGLFDETFTSAGDYEFWLRLAAAGERFLKIDGFSGEYLARKDGVEKRAPVRSAWETARARSRYRDVINLERRDRHNGQGPAQAAGRAKDRPGRERAG